MALKNGLNASVTDIMRKGDLDFYNSKCALASHSQPTQNIHFRQGFELKTSCLGLRASDDKI